MKLKILIGIVVIIIGVATIVAIASKNNNIDTSINNSENDFPEQLEKTAQALFNQPEPEKKAIPESAAYKDQPTKTNAEYLAELAGPVHNEWGIRDDILKYIEKTIPPENEKARSALIKYAAASQFIYYKATQEEAIKAFSKMTIALDCLGYSLPDKAWIEVSRGIDDLMKNSPDRDKHMWDINENYFGWKILGNGGLSMEQVKHICETGDY